MDTRQARLVYVAAIVCAAHFLGDERARDECLDAFAPKFQESADGFTYLAVAAADIYAVGPGSTQDAALASVTFGGDVLIGDAKHNFETARALAREVARGGSNMAQIAMKMDVPTAINSTFGLAVAVLRMLGAATGRSPAEWANTIAAGSEKEMS